MTTTLTRAELSFESLSESGAELADALAYTYTNGARSDVRIDQLSLRDACALAVYGAAAAWERAGWIREMPELDDTDELAACAYEWAAETLREFARHSCAMMNALEMPQ